MKDPTQVTVRCSGESDDGTQCERTMTVHVHYKYRDHYCHDHRDSEGGSR